MGVGTAVAPRRGDVPPGASRGCVSRGPQPHTEVTGSPQSHPCQETHPSNGKRPQDVLHPPARPPPPPPPPLPAVSRSPTPHDVTGTRDGSRGQSHTRHCQHSPPPGPHPPPPPRQRARGLPPPLLPKCPQCPPTVPGLNPVEGGVKGTLSAPPRPPPAATQPLSGVGAPPASLGTPKGGGGGWHPRKGIVSPHSKERALHPKEGC